MTKEQIKDLEKMKEFLEEKGYGSYIVDEIVYGQNDVITIRVFKNLYNGKYELDYAIKAYFDRWANKLSDNMDELIDYLRDEAEVITKAMSEIIYDIVKDKLRDNKREELDDIAENMCNKYLYNED